MDGRDVPLPQAAAALRLSYLAARDLIFRGSLIARQGPNGRWLVDRESLRCMLREREQQQDASAVAHV